MLVARQAGGKTAAVTGSYRWYALAVLTIAQLCHAMDRSIVAVVLDPVGREFALTDSQLGLLAGLAYGGAFACAAIPFGLAVDRVDRRRMLAIVIAVWSVFTAVCGLAQSYVALLLSRSAVGASEAGATPTGLSLISDYFPPSERSTAVGIWYMSAGLGATAAFIGGAYVVAHFGWRAAFLAAGLPGVAIALLVLLTLKEPIRGGVDAAPAANPGSFPARIRLIVAQPGLLHCMAGIVLAAITLSGLTFWIVSFLVRMHGLSLPQGGLVAALAFGVLASIGGGIAGVVTDRVNRRRGGFDPKVPAIAAAVIWVLTAALVGGGVLATSTPLAIALLLCGGFVCTAYNGPANGLFVTLAPQAARGLSVSILQFWCNLVGMGIGPLIVGTVSEIGGPANGVRWGLLAILGFNLWAAVHFLLLARRVGRRPSR